MKTDFHLITNSKRDCPVTMTHSPLNPRRVRWLNGRQFSAWQASKVLGEAREAVRAGKKPEQKQN